MRRFLLCFFITVFCVADVFAAESAISRTIPTKNATESVERGDKITTKNRVASRTVQVAKPADKQVNVVSRSVSNRQGKQHASLDAIVNTVGRSARTEAASINNNPALRRAGITLRASTAEVKGQGCQRACQGDGSR